VLAGILAMMLGMQLAGFAGMVRGVVLVPVRDLGMMRGRHMVFVVMMLGRLAMMFGGLVVMLGGLAVVFGDFGVGHGGILQGTDIAVHAARVRMADDRPVPIR
jgi:hypothetical protein